MRRRAAAALKRSLAEASGSKPLGERRSLSVTRTNIFTRETGWRICCFEGNSIQRRPDNMSTYGGNAAPSQRVSTVPSSWVDRLAIGMQDPLLLLARVLLGAIFVQSGFGKLTNLGGF